MSHVSYLAEFSFYPVNAIVQVKCLSHYTKLTMFSKQIYCIMDLLVAFGHSYSFLVAVTHFRFRKVLNSLLAQFKTALHLTLLIFLSTPLYLAEFLAKNIYLQPFQLMFDQGVQNCKVLVATTSCTTTRLPRKQFILGKRFIERSSTISFSKLEFLRYLFSIVFHWQ